MNVEFHYYAIYALALEAGFDAQKAFIMANSSQEVDASTTAITFDTPRGRIDVPVTQNYLFWDEKVKRDVYLPYHFIPGDTEISAKARIDGGNNPYAVTANSETARELLVSAFKDKDAYIMGTALHTFADTWAHQNFCGLQDEWNDIGSTSMVSGLPPAGHLQALSKPDEPDARWEDARLVPEQRRIINKDRFAIAAKKIFRYLRVFLGKPFNDDELVIARLEAIWVKPSREERLADYVICWDIKPYEPGLWRRQAGAPADTSAFSGIRHYDKLSWLKHQFDRATGRSGAAMVPADSSYFSTDLHRWNQAAIEHRRRVLTMLERKGL
jgi:hypothetical protein